METRETLPEWFTEYARRVAELGILPHQLLDCTTKEFIFDMSILTEEEKMNEEEKKARKEWQEEMMRE